MNSKTTLFFVYFVFYLMLNFTTELNLKRETELVQISSKASLRFTDTELRAAKRKPCNKESNNNQQAIINPSDFQFSGPYNEGELYSMPIRSIYFGNVGEMVTFHNKEYTLLHFEELFLQNYDSDQDSMFYSILYPGVNAKAMFFTVLDGLYLMCFNKETLNKKKYNFKAKFDNTTESNTMGIYYLAECPEEFKDKKSGFEPSIFDKVHNEAEFKKIKCSDITIAEENPSYCTGIVGPSNSWLNYNKKQIVTSQYTFELISSNPISPTESRSLADTRKRVYSFEDSEAIVLVITYFETARDYTDSFKYLSVICFNGNSKDITVDYSHLSKQSEALLVRIVQAYKLKTCPFPKAA